MVRDFTVETNGIYRSGDLVMVPGGVERILAHIYFQLESEDLLEVIFHEGNKPTLLWFLSTYMSPERSTLLCYRKSPEGPYGGLTPVGFGWITQQWKIGEHFRKSEFGMGFFRGVSPYETTMLGRMQIDWAFANLPVDTLLGVTPEPNRAVSLIARRVGFSSSGPIPGFTAFRGKLCAAVIQSMTRERWNQILSEGRISNAA